MKTFKDFLKENNKSYQCAIGSEIISFNLVDDKIKMLVNGVDEYLADNENDVDDFIYGNYNTEIRFCEQCGKPYDTGYIAGDGWWYCCEECFESTMDTEYGKGKWRATDKEGEYGGFYEALNDEGAWEDTSIFWTQWND